MISANESAAYDLLYRHYPIGRADPSQTYRSADRITIHKAECHFVRFQRMQIGRHHNFSLVHLGQANEATL